jgi:crotonobetainyl-CoA:carnitine CoA-transferase CaiB-like acyl-CoA transferase
VNAPTHMLSGYKVIDISQYIAGPTATRTLAEMGADVIKIELAKAGDRSRKTPYLKHGRSGYFVQQNRGKKSLCLDTKNPAAIRIIKELIPKVDVLVENFAPGVIGRMGLDYETVRALNPRIIMCSISTFGQKGPLAHLPGYDYIAQAYSGVTSLIGEPDGQCYFPIAAMGDASTGLNAALAIVTALLHRERSGRGQFLDIALVDTYFSYHHVAVHMYSLSDGKIKLTRSGKHLPYGAPCSVHRGHSHYITIIAGADHQWRALCEAMERPDLLEDPRFADRHVRVNNQEELFDIIQGWLASMPSDEAIMERLHRHRVPAAPVLAIDEVMKHPHMRQRGTITRVRDRILGEFELPNFPLRFSEFPDNLELEAPLLGEHNEEILTQYLGYEPERIRELEREGVLYSESI